MGNIGIALGGGKAFSTPAWFILLMIGFAVIGIRHVVKKVQYIKTFKEHLSH